MKHRSTHKMLLKIRQQ